jgi:hypothetical protein
MRTLERSGMGMGALGLSIAQSLAKRKKAEDALASQRRITEAELEQKQADQDTTGFQEQVTSWVPKAAVAVGILIFTVVLLRNRRRPR